MEKIEKKLRCRTCLKQTNPSKSKNVLPDTLYDGKPILKMFNFCIPEMTLELIPEPTICKTCLQSINNLYRFKNMCLKNNINYYKKNFNGTTSSDFSKEEPSVKCDIDNSNTKNKILISSDTTYDSDTDINQNESLPKNPVNINQTASQKDNLKKKTYSIYRKRFTNTDCSGCKNKIRDVRYHKESKTDFVCLNCDKKFPSINDMRKHTYTHLYLHECKICGKKWRDAYQLNQHLRTHTKEKPFECPECGKRFVQSHNLNQHLAVHNGGKKNQNRCEECGKILSTKYNLKIHLTTHNIGIKPRCARCNKWFYTDAALVKHSEICVTVKNENDIFITEPNCLKTEEFDYVKQENQSDDDGDVFIEETRSGILFQSTLSDQQSIFDSVKKEYLVTKEENGY